MSLNTSQEQRSEADLIARIRAGSRDDFRLLVSAYQGMIFSSIVRQGIDPESAKELTQEVFLKAYTNLSSYRFEAGFGTWLMRIAINHCANHFASKAFRQQQLTQALSEGAHEHPCQHAPADGFDREALGRLRTVVMTLPLILREVVVLCCFEQRSYEEVAGLLEIPVGTVRSRLHKARLKIKELYFQE